MLMKLLSIILGGLTLYYLVFWIWELFFYARNGWDFKKETGLPLYFGGDYGLTRRMTPIQKLYFGYPLLVTVFAVVFVATAVIAFRGQ